MRKGKKLFRASIRETLRNHNRHTCARIVLSRVQREIFTPHLLESERKEQEYVYSVSKK